MAVDTRLPLIAGQPNLLDVQGAMLRGAQTAAAIEQIPLLQRQEQLRTQQFERQAAASDLQARISDTNRKAGIIYNYATQLKSLPMAQRRTFLNTIPEGSLRDLGIDPEQIQGLAIDDASIDTAIAQLKPLIDQQVGSDSQPAELQTFEALTEGLTPSEIEEAKRVRLGLGARAKGKKNVDIGGVPYILDQDSGTLTPVEVGGAEVTAETVGRSKGQIKARETGAVEDVKTAKAFVADAVPKLSAIEQNIANYDEVIQAIDSGARTGSIVSRLPSINEASKTLDNLRTRLGLDVVSMGSFGALSESEMQIALSAALPTNKEPAALREWVVQKQNAQRKAAEALRDAVSFLENGGTVGELIQLSKTKKQDQPAKPDQKKRLKYNPDTGMLE